MSKAFDTKYDIIIGLEVHAQLASESKIFCSCATEFGQPPNSQVCPVCSGLPGTLPVLNEKVFELGLRGVLALGGTVSKKIKFDRKNYFYPDLPKGYQISQYDMPIGVGGEVEILTEDGSKKIHLERLHLEEDAGKLSHEIKDGASCVDLNRAGVPLAEIVSKPTIKSPEEAYQYLVNLKAILKAVGVSEVNMEKGQLRCDANISLRKSPDDPFGTKVEIKNLNSFRFVRSALEYEIKRQEKLLDEGEAIVQETRLWDDVSGRTISMRSKEEAHDYRYFPEPDLVPFEVSEEAIQEIQNTMPPLPKEIRKNFQEKYKLNDYDTQTLLQDDAVLQIFQNLSEKYSEYKNLANWLLGPLTAYTNEKSISLEEFDFNHDTFIEMLKLVDDGVVSFKACKEEVFPVFIETGKSPKDIVDEKGLGQISDQSALEGIIDEIVKANPQSVSDYQSGKKNAISFLIGQIMRQTKGKANPNLVSQMLQQKMSSS